MAPISAIVVNYHAYEELDACLASLGSQAGVGEIIVVDQATEPAARHRVADRYPAVTWISRDRNSGFGAGVNEAARVASGRMLFVVNPDSLVQPGAPAALAAFLDAHDDVAVAGSRILDTDGAVQGSARRFPTWSTFFAGRSSWLSRRFPSNRWTRHNILSGSAAGEARAVDWVSGAAMMIRRDAFELVGGFDERYFLYWEDADLCRRLRSRGWATAYVPDATVVHHGGRSSGSRLAPLASFHLSAFRYFMAHSSPVARLAAPLVGALLALRLAGTAVTRTRRRRSSS